MKFVAADPLTGDISMAAQIAAQTLGPEFKQWLNDPQKLLQLIAAAEGANSGGGGGQGQPGGVTVVPFGSVPNVPGGHWVAGPAPDWQHGNRNRRSSSLGRRQWFRLQEAGSDSGHPLADSLWTSAEAIPAPNTKICRKN